MNEITITLPRLYPKQQEIKDDDSRFKVICAGRRVGKTILVTDIAVNAMLQKLRVCYITPTFLLADEIYDKILEAFPPLLISKQNKSSRKISIITGGWISFFSGEALSRSRGLEYDLIIIDEASQIPDLKTEWYSSLRPLLMKTGGKAYIISTPLGMNYFYSLFQKGVNKENGFKSWQFTSYENPHLPKDELDELVKEMPEAIYKQEILAEPMQNQNNPIGTDNINNNIITELSTEPEVVIGIDVASVVDWTVIVGLDINGKMTRYQRFQHPWPVVKQIIEALPSDILKVIDSTGAGEVLYQSLQETCQNIIGMKFTTESKPKMFFQMIKDIEAGNLKYNQEAANEFHTLEYKYSSTGHISFAAQQGYHDDICCAIALANFYKNQAVQSQGWKLHFI